jgi:hypothetical protein
MHETIQHEASMTETGVLLVGGCHGTCCIRDSNDEEGKIARRQIVFANCLVLAFCFAIVALVAAGISI